MKILIVENDSRKAMEVQQFATERQYICKHVFTKNDLLKEVKNHRYDVIIIDIYIPLNYNDTSHEPLGVDAIQYLMETEDNIFRPKTILALTKYYSDEMLVSLNRYGVCCISYDESDSLWKSQLDDSINYVINANVKKADLAIITAVDIEFEALKKVAEWEHMPISDESNEYYWTTINNADGDEINIVMAQANHMGLVSATNLTTRIAKIFDPSCIIMIGIAGGRKGKVSLGDVVIAVEAWDYSSGSIESTSMESAELNFLPNPHYKEIDNDLKKVFSSYSRNRKLLFDIRQMCQMSKFDRDVQLHLGSIASGPAVIKSDLFVEKYIKTQNRKFLAIDMETYGVYYAASLIKPSKQFVSIKSISDVADCEKDDEYQLYGSLLAAYLAFHYIFTDYKKSIT